MNFNFFLFRISIPIIIITAGTDRILKAYIMDYLRLIPEKSIFITSFLNITEVWNYGISFGFLRADTATGITLLLFMTVAIISFLSALLVQAKTYIEMIAFAFIIGGACGNLFDRVYYGAVYDFLDFHLNGLHFWTFNPADAYISFGAFLLICYQVKLYVTQSKDKKNE
jgi:signal peptidase II